MLMPNGSLLPVFTLTCASKIHCLDRCVLCHLKGWQELHSVKDESSNSARWTRFKDTMFDGRIIDIGRTSRRATANGIWTDAIGSFALQAWCSALVFAKFRIVVVNVSAKTGKSTRNSARWRIMARGTTIISFSQFHSHCNIIRLWRLVLLLRGNSLSTIGYCSRASVATKDHFNGDHEYIHQTGGFGKQQGQQQEKRLLARFLVVHVSLDLKSSACGTKYDTIQYRTSLEPILACWPSLPRRFDDAWLLACSRSPDVQQKTYHNNDILTLVTIVDFKVTRC
jgi:hypothetical protein